MSGTIIIFGAAVRPDGSPSPAMRDRVQAALQFAATLEGVQFMPTGGVGRHGRAEAVVMADLLRGQGIPASRITIEPTAVNTLASVRACVRLLGRSPGPVYAASSAYHLPRCLWLLRRAGLDARPCPPPRVAASSRLRKRWYWRLREVPALMVDSVLLLALRLVKRL